MSDADEDIEVRSAATVTVPTIWYRMALFAVPLAVIALALSIWALASASVRNSETVALSGDPKLRVCNAVDMVAKAVAVPGRDDLVLVGGADYLLDQLDANTPDRLVDAVRAYARDLQDVGMNALAGVPYSDPRQAARQAEWDFDRKQVRDLCT